MLQIWVLAMATVLDPRFKTSEFGNQTNAQLTTIEEAPGYSREEVASDNLWTLLDS